MATIGENVTCKKSWKLPKFQGLKKWPIYDLALTLLSLNGLPWTQSINKNLLWLAIFIYLGRVLSFIGLLTQCLYKYEVGKCQNENIVTVNFFQLEVGGFQRVYSKPFNFQIFYKFKNNKYCHSNPRYSNKMKGRKK